jgi:hypothetical protein
MVELRATYQDGEKTGDRADRTTDKRERERDL